MWEKDAVEMLCCPCISLFFLVYLVSAKGSVVVWMRLKECVVVVIACDEVGDGVRV